MKKALTVLVVFGAGMALGRLFDGRAPRAEAGNGGAGKCAARNGDVNADGGVDLSDAITILGNLFLGNPRELLPLCAAPAPSGLPETGLTRCYDQNAVEIPCDSATCPGQDGFYATGCPADDRFLDNTDGTVTDRCTGLMWQKDTADINGDGQRNDGDTRPWCEALAYSENLSLAGHEDWRLPNVRELQGIVDYGRVNPAIDPVFGAFPSPYWSSTSFAGNARYAWCTLFSGGYVDSDFVGLDKGSRFYVRAVRSEP